MKYQNPEKMAGLYHPEALFVGTIAEDIADSTEGHVSYFHEFYRGKRNLNVAFDAARIRLLGDDIATAGGRYSICFDEGNERVVVPARFSFVYVRDEEGNMKITQHHSSANPKIGPSRQPLPALVAQI